MDISPTADYVMILVEMVHDVSIIRLNGTRARKEIREELGDSVGRWEGNTMVVDTTDFPDNTKLRLRLTTPSSGPWNTRWLRQPVQFVSIPATKETMR